MIRHFSLYCCLFLLLSHYKVCWSKSLGLKDLVDKLNVVDGNESKEKSLSKDGSRESSEDKGNGIKFKNPYKNQEDENQINCREYNEKTKTNAEDCAFMGSSNKIPVKSMGDSTLGRCRWDYENAVCYCPRTKEDCYGRNLKDKCYWYESHDDDDDAYGKCISNAEKFYVLLQKLLVKRGKKDFAIRINYKSTPGLGEFPYGPNGHSHLNYANAQRRGGPESMTLGQHESQYGNDHSAPPIIPYIPQPEPPSKCICPTPYSNPGNYQSSPYGDPYGGGTPSNGQYYFNAPMYPIERPKYS